MNAIHALPCSCIACLILVCWGCQRREMVRYDVRSPASRKVLEFPTAQYGSAASESTRFPEAILPEEPIAIRGELLLSGGARPPRLSLKMLKKRSGTYVTYRSAQCQLEYPDSFADASEVVGYEFLLKAPRQPGRYEIHIANRETPVAAEGVVTVRRQ